MAKGGLFGRGLPFWGSSRPSHLPNTRMQALHRLMTHAWRRHDLAIYTVMLFIPHDKPDLQVLGSRFTDKEPKAQRLRGAWSQPPRPHGF